jgi:predicted nucleic acid-binding protein
LTAWKEFSASVWGRACTLWSELRAQGRSHNDADILIASHALHYEVILVSANVDHFRGLGAPLENWNEPESR